MDLSSLGRAILVVGLGLAVVGLALAVAGALGLGRLPGDLSFGKGNVRVYVPLATFLLLSAVATIVLNLISALERKWRSAASPRPGTMPAVTAPLGPVTSARSPGQAGRAQANDGAARLPLAALVMA